MDKYFGTVNTGSTSSIIRIVARETSARTPVVGRSVVLDMETTDGTYRALGTVSDIITLNESLKDNKLKAVTASEATGVGGISFSKDIREIGVKIQATYRKNSKGGWDKASSALPTSPPSGSGVLLLDEEILEELIASEKNISHVGTMRGLSGVPAPLTVPNFSSARGAVHSAVIGRSGSGKTAFATYMLAAQMSSPDHAIIVVDPQGQWSNENGFVFSLKSFAAGLGREVKTLRVSEDIQLPMDEEILTQLFEYTNVWAKMKRMAPENRRIFSEEIVTRIAWKDGAADTDPRTLLTGIFKKMSASDATLNRIYARGEALDNLRRELAILAGEEPPQRKDEEEAEPVSEEEWEAAEHKWAAILSKFTPIINLFSSKNLNGGDRHPLGGDRGFLSTIMKARRADDVAPYVILDMSTDVVNSAKASYAKKTGNQDQLLGMRKMLDNVDIKAIIVSTILDQVKTSSEEAFAVGGGNLNTQIVFDEAWRYAPNLSSSSSNKPIDLLSSQLEGFALDTRKYGIGWTYILQSPSDLNRGIWKQLSFVYTGYGIIGSDKRILGELMDESDRQAHIGLYDQFSPPGSTGIYPFMMNGPISPLIFTNTPIFVDVYNNHGHFLNDNAEWVDRLCEASGKPPLSKNPKQIAAGEYKPAEGLRATKKADSEPAKKLKVYGNHSVSMQPQDGARSVDLQHSESMKNSTVEPPPF